MRMTRGRIQATLAFDQVQALAAKDIEPYAQIIAKLAPMIMSCGLAQSLAFLAAKGEPKHQLVLEHLTAHLSANSLVGLPAGIRPGAMVGEVVRAQRTTYRLMSRVVLGATGWLKRFASAREIDVKGQRIEEKTANQRKEGSA